MMVADKGRMTVERQRKQIDDEGRRRRIGWGDIEVTLLWKPSWELQLPDNRSQTCAAKCQDASHGRQNNNSWRYGTATDEKYTMTMTVSGVKCHAMIVWRSELLFWPCCMLVPQFWPRCCMLLPSIWLGWRVTDNDRVEGQENYPLDWHSNFCQVFFWPIDHLAYQTKKIKRI